MTFDCPDGVITSARRNLSNTPLQALTTMNDPVFFECTQALGRRLLAADLAGDRERLRHAGQITLGRELSDAELDRLGMLLMDEADRFAQDPAAAARYAGSVSSAGGQPVEAQASEAAARSAAWVSVASALMNLDEFFTRE
jgi:hypothetical protein